MARASPIQQLHDKAGALVAPYGPPESGIPVVQTYGEFSLEYAALRKSAALFDWPHRGALVITGADRIAFLNRMVTQELKDLQPFRSRRSFWLNRKGRIDADLRLIELGDRLLADVDVFAAERAASGLGEFVITEDVSIANVGEAWHRLALHGPAALRILGAVGTPLRGPAPADLAPGDVAVVAIAGAEVVAARSDDCGEPGRELTVPLEQARAVYERFLALAHAHEDDPARRGTRPDLWLRPAGWLAFNTARIEAGTPLYNLDFGPDSLPHETGVLNDRVSFRKGCYLGQEVVARMESRGHSKRTLVALRCDAPPSALVSSGAYERPLPVSGAAVLAGAADAEAVGVVTSSTLSPLLGGAAVAFAAVKPGHAQPGTVLTVEADGERVQATVQPGLAFVSRESTRSAAT